MVPGPSCKAGREGGAVRRRRRRDFWWLRPLSGVRCAPGISVAASCERRGNFDRLDVLRATPPLAWRDGHCCRRGPGRDLAGRSQACRLAQAADMADWLPNDLLLKLDRCSHGAWQWRAARRFSIPAVVEAGYTCCPTLMKVRDGRGKYLLRTVAGANAMPASQAVRRRNRVSPCRSAPGSPSHGTRIGALVAAQPGIQPRSHVPSKVRSAFQVTASGKRRHGMAAWSLLFYALWHRSHIEAVAPDGDVFEVLAAR